MLKLGHTLADSKAKWPEISESVLKELREWANERGLPDIPMEQLALFYHSCFYDKEATLKCMHTYYHMRANVPEFFANRNPREDYLQFSLKALHFCTLPKPDPDGNIIIFHRLADHHANSYMFNDGIKLLLMTLDASLHGNGCTPGYVFLFDMHGAGLRHLTRLSVSSIRRYFEYLQEGLPVRLKAMHVMNAVWFMDQVLTLIRPFMKRELLSILHLYTRDVSEVYEHIPPECLPKDYGGELDSVESLHETHCLKLDELREYFIEEEKLFRGYHSDPKKESIEDIPNHKENNANHDTKL